MREKLLGKADIRINSSSIEQEDYPHGWKQRDGQSEVRKGQHGDETVHRLIQRGPCFYEKEDGAVPQHGNEIDIWGKWRWRHKCEHAPSLGAQ